MDSLAKLSGSFTALVTPFQDGKPDFATLERIVETQIEAGISGLVPVGTTGESPTLDRQEHLEVIAEVVRMAAGRVSVIAGTGANATKEAIDLTQGASKRGADAFLQVAPYYNKPSQEGLFAHFSAIAEATDKPIMLYSIPGRCGIEIAVNTVARLIEACPNIRTIKEASGNVERVTALKKACGDELTVLSGDDGLTLDFCKAGAEGIVSVAANLKPSAVVSLTNACLAKDYDEAARIAERYHALFHELVFLDGNPVTIKEVLFQAGVIPSVELRLPLVRTSKENQTRIQTLLKTLPESSSI